MIQLVRYGIVGITNNALIYSIFLFLTHIGFEPKKTMTLLYLLGTIVSYIGNWRWTFASKGSFIRTGSRFFLAYWIGYSINLMLLLIFVDYYGYSFQWIQALAIIIVAGFLFIMSKCFIFVSKGRSS